MLEIISLCISIIATIVSGISIWFVWRTAVPHIQIVSVSSDTNGAKKMLVVNTGYYKSVIIPRCGLIYWKNGKRKRVELKFRQNSVTDIHVYGDGKTKVWKGDCATKTIEAKESLYLILDGIELQQIVKEMDGKRIKHVRFYLEELSCVWKKPIAKTSEKIKLQDLL